MFKKTQVDCRQVATKNPPSALQDLGLDTFGTEAPFFVLRAPRPALEQVVEVPSLGSDAATTMGITLMSQ